MQINTGKHVIESKTGEVIEDFVNLKDLVLVNREDYISDIFVGEKGKPIQLVFAEMYKKTPAEVQTYIGQLPKKASEYSGKIIRAIGATPWFSGGFTRMADDQWDDGFHKILIKLDETYEKDIIIDKQVKTLVRNVIIATSGKRVAQFFAQMIELYGAYDFPFGVSIRLMIEKDLKSNVETVTLIPEDF